MISGKMIGSRALFSSPFVFASLRRGIVSSASTDAVAPTPGTKGKGKKDKDGEETTGK